MPARRRDLELSLIDQLSRQFLSANRGNHIANLRRARRGGIEFQLDSPRFADPATFAIVTLF